MKALVGLGKLVALLFWLAVLANLIHPFAHPFDTLLKITGGVVLAIHIIELLAFGKRLQGRPHPLLDRLQVLLFGVFHMLSLKDAKGGSNA
ncbi:hypothetical protein D3C81_777800 [compost metagenome]